MCYFLKIENKKEEKQISSLIPNTNTANIFLSFQILFPFFLGV